MLVRYQPDPLEDQQATKLVLLATLTGRHGGSAHVWFSEAPVGRLTRETRGGHLWLVACCLPFVAGPLRVGFSCCVTSGRGQGAVVKLRAVSISIDIDMTVGLLVHRICARTYLPRLVSDNPLLFLLHQSLHAADNLAQESDSTYESF